MQNLIAWMHGPIAWMHRPIAWMQEVIAWMQDLTAWMQDLIAWMQKPIAWMHGRSAWMHGPIAWVQHLFEREVCPDVKERWSALTGANIYRYNHMIKNNLGVCLLEYAERGMPKGVRETRSFFE